MRQVQTMLVLPEGLRPGALGGVLRRLQQQQQEQSLQVAAAAGAVSGPQSGGKSNLDCTSSGASEGQRGLGNSGWQQQQEVGLTPWSVLAAPVGVFYEGYGEGVLTAVSLRKEVGPLVVDYQLYRRGEMRCIEGTTVVLAWWLFVACSKHIRNMFWCLGFYAVFMCYMSIVYTLHHSSFLAKHLTFLVRSPSS
jgi:hypothetical protein